MLTKNIVFKNFMNTKISLKVKENLKNLLKEDNQVIESLKQSYKNRYNFKKIIKLKKHLNIRIIGIGGSILGAKAIYNFLSIKKKIYFIDNLKSRYDLKKKKIFKFSYFQIWKYS